MPTLLLRAATKEQSPYKPENPRSRANIRPRRNPSADLPLITRITFPGDCPTVVRGNISKGVRKVSNVRSRDRPLSVGFYEGQRRRCEGCYAIVARCSRAGESNYKRARARGERVESGKEGRGQRERLLRKWWCGRNVALAQIVVYVVGLQRGRRRPRWRLVEMVEDTRSASSWPIYMCIYICIVDVESIGENEK